MPSEGTPRDQVGKKFQETAIAYGVVGGAVAGPAVIICGVLGCAGGELFVTADGIQAMSYLGAVTGGVAGHIIGTAGAPIIQACANSSAAEAHARARGRPGKYKIFDGFKGSVGWNDYQFGDISRSLLGCPRADKTASTKTLRNTPDHSADHSDHDNIPMAIPVDAPYAAPPSEGHKHQA